MISEWEFLGRVAVAALLGGTLGFDRELRRAAAGVRTYALVGMGSAAFIAAVVLFCSRPPKRSGMSIAVKPSSATSWTC